MKKLLPLLSIALFLASCGSATKIKPEDGFVIRSVEFNQGEAIPDRFSAYHDNLSPELYWGNAPEGTVSFALLCDDPDAGSDPWVHWIIYNIPADQTSLEENITPETQFDNGILQGKNSFHPITNLPVDGYCGPRPPGGTHRYFFKLYALDTTIQADGIYKSDLLELMDGHILGETELMGMYP